MDNHKKSIEILKLMGWHPVQMPKYHSEGLYRLADENGKWLPDDPAYVEPDSVWHSAPDLYKPQNADLAWLVLNWVAEKSLFKIEFMGYWDNANSWVKPLAIAQTEWLDKVLEFTSITAPNHSL